MKKPNVSHLMVKAKEAGTVPTNIPRPKQIFGIRHVQCALIFFALAVAYALRVNMSVAIVAMTDKSTNTKFDEYDWTESTKSLILSSFFWGYVVTQVPAGQLAQRYGAKLVVFWGVLICSILAILTPICAKIGGSPLVCTLRVIQGLCQGTVFPSSHNLLSKWAPFAERGKLGTISYSGVQFGTALMLCISGELASSAFGWPSIFYISGAAGCVWAVLWFFFASSCPAENRFISEEEKLYIEMIPTDEDPGAGKNELKPKLPTPWLDILTSVPFYVVLCAHCANNWGFWTLLTEIPTYMKNILGMDIKSNALLSSLPYWAMFLLCFVFLIISEILSRNKCMGLAFSRKLFNTLGHWIPAIGLIGMGYMDGDNVLLAIIFLTLTVGMNASCYLGFQMNHIDLSSNFAGTLMGLTNCAANIMSIIAPLMVGFIVTDEKNPDQWRIVFFIAAAFFFVGNLLFILFGKFTTQSWNEPKTVTIKNVTNGQNVVLMESQN
ncbi:putative inorganic phosphate cotransporter isoform X1 [Eupeodes corollae]|uniref:putative inorganic phosphate cotransporter isoform X1 n=1 Tax=Eupeodes corollae TaxID=290404 RepID=UPI002492CF07|nr:putative inorganic phosphate cotransporter isoform X1 [Eupeodes corollae]